MVSRRRFNQAALAAALSGGVVPLLAGGSAGAQEISGSPAASAGAGVDGNAALVDLLAMAPDLLADPDWMSRGLLASFADFAVRLGALELAAPDSMDDAREDFPWREVTLPLAVPGTPFDHGFHEEFRDLFGWDVIEVDQTLELGQPPSVAMMLRGRFDPSAIQQAWTDQGYEMLDVQGQEVASLSAEGEVDLSSDIGRIALARMNNAAILPDGTLVYTPTLALMESVVATWREDAPSLGDRAEVRGLVDAVERPLSSAILIPGAVLAGIPEILVGEQSGLDIDDLATRIASEFESVGEMPPILLALAGFVSGTELVELGGASVDSGSLMVVACLTLGPEFAEEAAAVALQRLEEGLTPSSRLAYRDLFTHRTARTEPDSSVFVLELGLARNEGTWASLIFRGDAGFLAW